MKSLTWCATAATSTVLAAAVFVSAQDAPKNAAQQNQPQTNPQNVQRQPQQPQPNTRTATTQVGANQNQADGQLAACLVIDNEGEVAVSKFAASKSENSDVKEFAEMLAKDHQAFIGKLNKFAATTGSSTQINRETTTTTTIPRDNNATTSRDNTTTPKRDSTAGNTNTTNRDPNAATANRDPNLPATRETTTHTTAFRGTGELDHLRIKREIGQLCVETMKKELSDKKGTDFDKCYIGSQIGAHLHMADTLKVLKNYASPELRTVLEEGEKTTTAHLDHARTLMKDLEKDNRKEVTSAKKTD